MLNTSKRSILLPLLVGVSMWMCYLLGSLGKHEVVSRAFQIIYWQDVITSDELIGHWHFETTEHNHVGIGTSHELMDFINDTTVVLGDINSHNGGVVGWYDIRSRALMIGGECFYEQFNFSLVDDVLHLQDAHNDTVHYTLRKYDKSNCNLQDEFISKSNIDIDLPLSTSFLCSQLRKKSMEVPIYFGQAKRGSPTLDTNAFHMVLGDRISELQDLSLYNEKHSITIAHEFRDNMVPVIYGHLDTPMDLILPVLMYYSEQSSVDVYFAMRDRYADNEFSVCLEKFDLRLINVSSASTMTLNEWVSSKHELE